jgi:hypothetical protein
VRISFFTHAPETKKKPETRKNLKPEKLETQKKSKETHLQNPTGT